MNDDELFGFLTASSLGVSHDLSSKNANFTDFSAGKDNMLAGFGSSGLSRSTANSASEPSSQQSQQQQQQHVHEKQATEQAQFQGQMQQTMQKTMQTSGQVQLQEQQAQLQAILDAQSRLVEAQQHLLNMIAKSPAVSPVVAAALGIPEVPPLSISVPGDESADASLNTIAPSKTTATTGVERINGNVPIIINTNDGHENMQNPVMITDLSSTTMQAIRRTSAASRSPLPSWPPNATANALSSPANVQQQQQQQNLLNRQQQHAIQLQTQSIDFNTFRDQGQATSAGSDFSTIVVPHKSPLVSPATNPSIMDPIGFSQHSSDLLGLPAVSQFDRQHATNILVNGISGMGLVDAISSLNEFGELSPPTSAVQNVNGLHVPNVGMLAPSTLNVGNNLVLRVPSPLIHAIPSPIYAPGISAEIPTLDSTGIGAPVFTDHLMNGNNLSPEEALDASQKFESLMAAWEQSAMQLVNAPAQQQDGTMDTHHPHHHHHTHQHLHHPHQHLQQHHQQQDYESESYKEQRRKSKPVQKHASRVHHENELHRHSRGGSIDSSSFASVGKSANSINNPEVKSEGSSSQTVKSVKKEEQPRRISLQGVDLTNVTSENVMDFTIAQKQGRLTLYQCPQCGKAFTRPYALKSHYRSHSGERPFVCTYPNCNLSFSRKHDLKRHARLHTQRKDFICRICHKAFARSDALTRHLKTSDPNAPSSCGLKLLEMNPNAALSARNAMEPRSPLGVEIISGADVPDTCDEEDEEEDEEDAEYVE